jgi:type III secretion system FlhB-like substrate exporter
MNATAKAIMSGAPSASGPMSDQDLVTFMWDKFHQIQEEARQQHLQILEQYRQMQEQSLQWMQQQQRHIHEQAMSMSEDTQHLPEQSGSGEIWLNEQLIQVAPSHEGRPQEAPRIARQLHEVPQKEERPEEAPQVRGQQQQDPQAKMWPVEAPPEEGRPPEGPRVKLRPNKDLHVRDRPPDLPKAGTPSHQEQQAQGPPNEALQVKEWPPEVPAARDQLLGRKNREVKVNCWEDLGGQPTKTKNKVKKKEEEGRWSWHKKCPQNPYFKQNWCKPPKKCLKARFRTSHEGQSVCCQSTRKGTKWKMRNAQKQFFLFVQLLFISFC